MRWRAHIDEVSNILIALGLVFSIVAMMVTGGWTCFVDSHGVERHPGIFEFRWIENIVHLVPPTRLVAYPPAFWAAPSLSRAKLATISNQPT